MSDETRVLLVRHGQSEWNASGRWQGQADPPLTNHGRTQAHEAARLLGTVDAIYASDLARAAETAMILSAALGVGPVMLDQDLRERDAGEWSGLTRDEIEARYPGYLADGRRPPGWEPDEVLAERARRALVRIHGELPGGDALVVTHGGLIYSLEIGLGAEFARIGNVEGRWFGITADRFRLGPRMELLPPQDATVPRQI